MPYDTVWLLFGMLPNMSQLLKAGCISRPRMPVLHIRYRNAPLSHIRSQHPQMPPPPPLFLCQRYQDSLPVKTACTNRWQPVALHFKNILRFLSLVLGKVARLPVTLGSNDRKKGAADRREIEIFLPSKIISLPTKTPSFFAQPSTFASSPSPRISGS